MTSIAPFVRHMILCDDVVTNPSNPYKLDARGMTSFVRSNPPGSFPVVLPQLGVYLEMSGGRGPAKLRIVAVSADTDTAVFASPARNLTFPDDPLRVVPVVFRIRRCIFPRAGLYWIQFWYNDQPIFEQDLIAE